MYITSRSFKNYKPESLEKDSSLVPWPIVDIIDSVDDKLFAFDALFNDILEQHAPVKSFKMRGKPNPCVTDNIRGLMKTRDKWHKEAKKTNDPLAWRTYKFFRQEVKREIRIAEEDFVAEQSSLSRYRKTQTTPIISGRQSASLYQISLNRSLSLVKTIT